MVVVLFVSGCSCSLKRQSATCRTPNKNRQYDAGIFFFNECDVSFWSILCQNIFFIMWETSVALFLCFSIFPHPVTQPCSNEPCCVYMCVCVGSHEVVFILDLVPATTGSSAVFPFSPLSLLHAFPPFSHPSLFFLLLLFLTLHSLTILHGSDEGNTLKES